MTANANNAAPAPAPAPAPTTAATAAALPTATPLLAGAAGADNPFAALFGAMPPMGMGGAPPPPQGQQQPGGAFQPGANPLFGGMMPGMGGMGGMGGGGFPQPTPQQLQAMQQQMMQVRGGVERAWPGWGGALPCCFEVKVVECGMYV